MHHIATLAHSMAPPNLHHVVLQLPCGHPGCLCHFKTPAGHTKHHRSAHPKITLPTIPTEHAAAPPRTTSPSLTPPPESDMPSSAPEVDEEFNPPNDGDPVQDDELGPPVPSHNIDSKFYGPGDRLYRNFHSSLTGKLTYLFTVVLSQTLLCRSTM